MNYNPKVSIVIPIYKVEKYLMASVKSSINQSYKNIEIILVDDGSPDKCPDICDSLALEYENILVIHKKNGGLSEARNFGIDRACGEYILFLDSDDTLINNAIERLVQKATSSAADMVIPDRYIQIIETTAKATERFHFDQSCYIEDPVLFTLDVMIGKGRAWRAHSLLYRTAIIRDNNIRFPVGLIAEDIIFNLQFMAKAKKLIFYKNATVNYLKRAGSITTSFQVNLDEIFLFIDDSVCNFLKATNQYNEFGKNKCKELLCRNAISYISDIFSQKCTWERSRRYKHADDFLSNERINAAFLLASISPYFDRKLAVIYYKTMFVLIKFGKNKTAYFLAELLGKVI